MKANKEYYLKMRGLFLRMGFIVEVNQLDIHFKINFLYNKRNQLIKML